MVDLIMFALLVPGDLALRLLSQLTQVLLGVLLHRVLYCLCQRQPVLVYPFIQPSVKAHIVHIEFLSALLVIHSRLDHFSRIWGEKKGK